MSDFEIENLSEEAGGLEQSLGKAAGMAAAFDAEMRRINTTFSDTGRSAVRLQGTLSSGVAKAIDGVVLDGMKLSDAMGVLAKSMVDAAWRAAVKPMANNVGGFLAAGVSSIFGDFSPFAKGGTFTQGRVMPFANGGVVSRPTYFPMRGGTGLMGEAGPEAIMPLTRGTDGKLGVRAAGGAPPVSIVMNIHTPDARSFQRSQSQIAARMSQALGRGARNR
ncbi:phage tail tape measure protein [Sagittula salina]|uniref:Phage tail tape measure protein n=1 Tax=Sagittula salina TaxID=2820268 RepID=A0A940MLN6_9RHOB|nr:phage tail tape measure protein [Sagittula salina]MBP0480991.1 phage tail tape measure protein [Sagittula salina]